MWKEYYDSMRFGTESYIEDNIMKAKVIAHNMGSLREAAEDFMSCISVAENVLKK